MTRALCRKLRSLKARLNAAQEMSEFLEQELRSAIGRFSSRAWDPKPDQALDAAYARVRRLRKMRGALRLMLQRGRFDELMPSYVVSTSFLRKAFEMLTETQDEHLTYATGPEDGERLFALTRLVTFDLETRSPVQAAPEPKSQMEALAELDRNGERLLATLHSHPGHGARATRPSCTDLKTQERLERLGYPAIGIVFSRTGHVRFYAKDRDFRVAVSGMGVEKLEEQLYRIADVAPSTSLPEGGRND